MNIEKTILILDLDGVLITSPPWKSDEMDFDGYSKFDSECVKNLNIILEEECCEIWLSSTRRRTKSLIELNTIFRNRGIFKEIKGFLPENDYNLDRKEEILNFLKEKEIRDFIIIDDDKSLNAMSDDLKEKLVLTDYSKGLNREKLGEALQKLKQNN